MANARKILIVDDDTDLRDALVEQLSLHEEFEASAVDTAEKVRLTENETAIVRFLYRDGQLPVSRETLLQEVWGYNSGVTTHTLETHIYRLRQKIEKDAANPEILVTEAGGYKLVP